MKQYHVFSAHADEASAGTIWQQKYPSRTIVTISRTTPAQKLKIFCVVRQFDANFLAQYNKDAFSQAKKDDHKAGQRWEIALEKNRPASPTLVMNQWYRRSCLGIRDLREREHPASRSIELGIRKAKWGWHPRTWFPGIRAACHQPDLVVVLATRLGVLGAWLGSAGVVFGLIALIPSSWENVEISLKWIVIAVLVIVLVLAGLLSFSICTRPRPAKVE